MDLPRIIYLRRTRCTQDLAVVVLLMLIPLLAPSESGAPAGLKTIARALGIAALKVAPHPGNCFKWKAVQAA